MSFKVLAISALVALAQARFGQEHPEAINEIAAVTSGGGPGVAATIAGGAISNLLAAANPCAKLQTGDKILAQLGMGADAVKAAQDFVAAEQNFNPFVQNIPTLCSDPTLPTTAVLRGIVPLIDPAVGGSTLANQLSAQSLVKPFDATGLSVAEVFVNAGFSNFTTKDLAGNVGAAPGSTSGSAAPPAESSTTTAAAASKSDAAVECVPPPPPPPPTTLCTVFVSSTTTTTSAAATSTTAAASTGTNDSATSSLAGVDFGLCVPTMKFEGGLGGRPATEFTFQAIDPKIQAIQEEALNPNIITNRICDELTNQCKSNQAAKDICQTAKAQILALGTRDRTTADAWNTALGFAGANTDPDGTAV